MRYNSGKLKQIKQLIREDKLNLSEKKKISPKWIYFFCKESVNVKKFFFSVFTNNLILGNI